MSRQREGKETAIGSRSDRALAESADTEGVSSLGFRERCAADGTFPIVSFQLDSGNEDHAPLVRAFEKRTSSQGVEFLIVCRQEGPPLVH